MNRACVSRLGCEFATGVSHLRGVDFDVCFQSILSPVFLVTNYYILTIRGARALNNRTLFMYGNRRKRGRRGN